SYSGTATVKNGTLLLDKDTAVVIDGAMSGPLIIGEDELPENTDVVRYLHCCQLPDDTDVTINASGLLDLNGFGENVRNLTFNGGDLDTGTGSILPIGDITVNANTNSQAIISGAVLALRFGVDVPAEALTLAGTGQSGFGALSSSFGSNSWAGNVTLSSNANISVLAGDFLNMSGAINGSFDVKKTGTGTLTL